MTRINPDCIGRYDFEHVVHFARMRYREGMSTIKLLQQMWTDIEREEVALVCLLDTDGDVVTNIALNCRHAPWCRVMDCRATLKNLIEMNLKKSNDKMREYRAPS